MHSNKREDIKEAIAGDIVAAIGLRKTTTGDTLCDPKHPVVLEKMVFPEPVVMVSIEPKTQIDQEKLSDALSRLAEEDPTFIVRQNEETGQTIISGMGELHLEVLIERLLREFGVGASVGRPSVAYKETITEEVESEAKFERPAGARSQFAHVKLRLKPADVSKPLVFESTVSKEEIPREFIYYVEKGVKEALTSGAIGGYPLTGIHCELYGGSYMEMEATEVAYQVAGNMALFNGVKKAKPILLEPIMDVEVIVPEAYMGSVVGDLNTRRGKINGMVPRNDVQVIAVSVPLSEMFGYAGNLRNITQGRANFTMQFSRYAPVPVEITKKMFENIV
jgi:elongation factor G